jgi:hypothetical protein
MATFAAAQQETAVARAASDRLTRWAGWWKRHPALAATIVYAVLSVLMVGQGLLPGRTLSSSDGLWNTAPWRAYQPVDEPGAGTRYQPADTSAPSHPYFRVGSNYELADAVVQFQPFFRFTRGALPDVPLWNPHVMAGRPFLANSQSAIFSPFSAPVYVLPFWKALGVIAILKLFVAALGTYLLGRALGMRFGGALAAGVVFAFGTFFVVWLAWPLTNVFALIPWLLLLTELVVRRPGPLPVAGLSALVALQFLGGHPESSFHALFVTVVYFAFRLLTVPLPGGRRPAAIARPVFAFGTSLLLGAVVTALVLTPFFEFLFQAGDYERRLRGEPSHTDPKFIGALLLHDYWGRPTQTAIEPFMSNRGFYAGGLTLMLAACALLLRPTAIRVAVAGFGVLSLLVVVGADPVFAAVNELPGFRTAHNGRMVIFSLLALALLAGWGLDDLSGGRPATRLRRGLALGAAAAIFCLPLAWMLVAGTLSLAKLGPALEVAWGFSDPPLPPAGADPVLTGAAPIVRMSALLQWLPLAGVGLGLVWLRLSPLRGGGRRLSVAGFVGLALALLVVDLFRANMGFNPAIPVEHAQQPTTPAIRYLQQRTPHRFVGISSPLRDQPLQPNVAMRYGLYDARGYDYPVERRFDRFWRATAAPPGDFVPPTAVAEPTAKALRALSLLSVSDVVQDPSGERLRLPGLRLVYAGPDAWIYRNLRAVPRAFVVERQRTVTGAAGALAAVTDRDFDARRVAITERSLPGLPEPPPSEPAPPAGGGAQLVAYGRERVVVRASARRRALLVLTDVHYPGWKVWVDGRRTDIERVDYLLRGVPLGRGRHIVEFRYEPASWRAGWITSVVGLVVVGGLAVAGLRRRRGRAVVSG